MDAVKPMLRKGAFYWALPVLDVDVPEWMGQWQPARFGGYTADGICMWFWIGQEEENYWPACAVGPEIVNPYPTR